MKKRNLAALGLTLALTLSMATPALAAELGSPQPPEASGSYLSWDEFLRQYMEAHPEHYEAFDADSYFEEEYRWMEKADYMDDMDLETQEEFKAAMWEAYLDSSGIYSDLALYDEVDDAYSAYLIDYYEAGHPGELERLTTGDLLAWQGYTETLTPEEQYRRDWDLGSGEPVRPSLLRTYASNRLNAEAVHADFLVYQAAWPDRLAEFDADAWFAREYDWTDKVSYMNSGNLRSEEEFREEMFVRYVEDNYWDWDGGILRPAQEERGLTLVVNGSLLSDAVLTAENGVSYTDAATLNPILGTSLTGDRVAIREAATAAGWDVVWNQANNEVILLDRARLTRGTILRSSGWGGRPVEAYVQYDFSKLDEMMDRLLSAAAAEAGQSYRTTETVELTFTALNSLDGDESYPARVTVDALTRDGTMDVTITADLSKLEAALSDEVRQAIASGMPKYAAQDLKGQLGALTARILYAPETGELFFHAPFLALLDGSLEEEAWYRLELGEDIGSTLLPQGGWDTGIALYESLLSSSGDSYYGAEEAYTDWAVSMGAVQTLFGAHAFTEENGTLTWSLDRETLGSILNSAANYTGMAGSSRLQDLFRELNVTLSVDKKGKVTSDAALRLDMDALGALLAEEESWGEVAPGEIALYQWLMNLFDFRLAAHGEGTADTAAASAQFHWKNQFKLEMESSSVRKAVRDLPLSTPPAGVEIVEL